MTSISRRSFLALVPAGLVEAKATTNTLLPSLASSNKALPETDSLQTRSSNEPHPVSSSELNQLESQEEIPGTLRLASSITRGVRSAKLTTTLNAALSGLVWALFLKTSNLAESEIRRATIAGNTLSWSTDLSYAHIRNEPVILLWDNKTKVSWFGARPGGAGTTNREGLQRALEASALSGGTVELDVGTYDVVRDPTSENSAWAINIPSNTTLIGQGIDSTIIKLADTQGPNTRLLSLDLVTGVTIRDLTLDGNETQQTDRNEQMGNIMVDGATHFLIERVRSVRAQGDALTIRGKSESDLAQHGRILNCDFNFCLRNGVTLGGYGFSDILIQGNRFGSEIDTQQVDFEPTHGTIFEKVRIIGNTFEKMESDRDEYSIVIAGRALSQATDIQVIGNTIHNAVLISSATKVQILGNTIVVDRIKNYLKHPGILVNRACEDVVIANNSIDAHSYGVFIRSLGGQMPTRIHLSNNNVQSMQKSGVYVWDATDVKVTANNIRGGGTHNGVHLRASTSNLSNLIVSGNTIDQFAQGVYLQGASDSLFQRCQIINNMFETNQERSVMKEAITFNLKTPILENCVISGNTKSPAIQRMFSDSHQNSFIISGNVGACASYSVWGSPEDTLAAPVGTQAIRRDGGPKTTLYIKEHGDGVNGWRPI